MRSARTIAALVSILGVLETMPRVEAAPASSDLAAVFAVERWDADLPGVELPTLTTELATALAATGKYEIVPQHELVRALTKKKKESFEACTAQACQLEIGKDVGADAAISAHVTRRANECTVTVKRMSVWTYWGGKKVDRAGGCSATELTRLLREGATALAELPASAPAGERAEAQSHTHPRRDAVSATATSSAAAGRLSRELIQKTIDAQLGRFMRCYQVRLTRRPELAGEVAVKFTIGTTGGVTEAALKTSTLQDTAAERCLVAVMHTLQFPPPTGGAVAVTYPFTFTND
jgi:TonB family protein